MKKWLMIGITSSILFGILFHKVAWFRPLVVAAAQNPTKKPQPPPMDVYLGLRDLELTSPREKIGLPAPASPTTPWRVVIDSALDSGAQATVVAVADRSASVYWVNVGGRLGGQSRETLGNAALKMVKIAGELQPQMQLTKNFPLPHRGGVIFYAVTYAGVFTATATQEEMRMHRGAFAKLGDAMQEIISAYKKTQGR
jgi:hypothetical protein